MDRTVIRLGLLGLGPIAQMPFPTTLLTEYGELPQSVVIHSGAVAAMGATQLALTVVPLAFFSGLCLPPSSPDFVSPTGAKPCGRR
ncbi:hypothetical protein [Streptomyces sp. NPDC015125]|uniref:hypothetical protein n=1 Tax=Streptomyces sp. NPDC015125 TaxID=3364938 RepID=UPI0036FE0A89